VTRDGAAARLGSVRAAANAGIAYLTEDRKGKGLLLGQGLPVNLTLMALDKICHGPFLDGARERAATTRATAEFDIRARDAAVTAGRLSGGNQQKLLLAKIMMTAPRVLVTDEPTRGIDIGTKAQIYRFIAGLAARGLAVVVISSEMQELIGLCHRILVMRAGRIVAELEGDDMSEDRIVIAATGALPDAA
jgi:ribose transport system ATP-binding protein